MAQSLTRIYLHIIFSTKQRQPYLKDKELRERTFGYLAGTCKNLKSPAVITGGLEDHIHILCRLSKTISVADLIRELKRHSSKWIKTKAKNLSMFQWQLGYGTFSVSPSHVEALKKYIANQKEHHRQETFQDEFRRICKKYGVEIDERYVWD